MKILVTGALGFIGSHFIEHCLEQDNQVIALARNTDQFALSRRVAWGRWRDRVKFIYGDITKEVCEVMRGVDVVVNFAAKTFVDHSILDPHPFIRSNILGTYNLLNQAIKHKLKRYIQISTDEVYGSLEYGYATEESPLNPTNPYSASKAAADMLVMSYYHTYGLPTIITRCENNFGPYQGSEKAIPTFIRCALNNEPIPIYGDGKHRRMWIHVTDHCRAIYALIDEGKSGEIYNIAQESELTNIQLAKAILEAMPNSTSKIEFIPDHDIRPGHDRRYAINAAKLKDTINWDLNPFDRFLQNLESTIKWYVDNPEWLY